MKLIVFFSVALASQCISQKTTSINPKLEASFELGGDYFEKDLSYIKKILDSDSYKVKVYSFLPRMIWSIKDEILLFDKFSGNLISFNTKTKESINKLEISDHIKKGIKPLKHNVDLIDINGDFLQFYDEKDRATLIYSLSKSTVLCSFPISNPIGSKFEESTDTLFIFSYKFNCSTRHCVEYHRYKNKRIPINEGNSFIRYENKLFYQSIENNKLQWIDLNNSEITLSKINLALNIDITNFDLAHVNETFYVLASNIEKGLGEFIFIDKKTGSVDRRVRINESIVSNDVIDLYDAESDYPSPDVDNTSSYLRMTSIKNKYFIFLQSKGLLKLYSFNL
jgi:hypothetical protein